MKKMKSFTRWKLDEFEQEKRSIKKEMDEVKTVKSPQELKNYLSSKIEQLSNTNEIKTFMRRFIYIMHTLILQTRYKLFTSAETNGLFELAEAILRVNGIHPMKSKLSRIYSELLYIKSQMAFLSGDIWNATWQQQLAIHIADGPFLGGDGYQRSHKAN